MTTSETTKRRSSAPAWPLVQQSPPVQIPPLKRGRNKEGWPCAIILPDMQIGYYRGGSGLEPTHDERAIAVALRIVKRANPHLVVLVGDNLDLPELGKYRLSPAYAQTTQATIDRAALMAAQVRSAAPNARIVWLAGNHEERLPNYLLDNASVAFGIRRGDAPGSWPVMSVPFLCRLDDHDVEYLAGYPAACVWITEHLRVIHGDKVASGGSTAHKYLATERSSVIYGHIHRREYAVRTREAHNGAYTVMAATPGCLARIDGAVPSTKGGIDLDGRPVVRYEDWQQGMAVIPYDEVTGRFVYEQVAIDDGWAMWRGQEFSC
jgi:predicted phosphodiesterase